MQRIIFGFGVLGFGAGKKCFKKCGIDDGNLHGVFGEKILRALYIVGSELGNVFVPDKTKLDPFKAEGLCPEEGVLEILGDFVGDNSQTELVQSCSASGEPAAQESGATCKEIRARDLRFHGPLMLTPVR